MTCRSRHHILCTLLTALLCLAAGILSTTPATALTVTVTPRISNIVPGMPSPVNLLYAGLENGRVPQTYTAPSTSGQFELLDGTVLGSVSRSLTLNIVNDRGSVGELLTVPPAIVARAQDAGQSRIRYVRVFSPTAAAAGAQASTILQIVPAPGGTFGLIGVRLEFNQPAPGEAPRPQSGGRITVPRGTRGLRAAATITYNGHGVLRGRWIVDGQIIGLVTRQLLPGLRQAVIASPTVPAFPTYASGLHRVQFEILAPAAAFDIPVLNYFVTGHDQNVPSARISLSGPEDRAHVLLDGTSRPTFSWKPVPEASRYLLRIMTLEPAATLATDETVNLNRPILTIMTNRHRHGLSPFDLPRLQPNRPYAWQVLALTGNTLIGSSSYRIVLFSGVPSRDSLVVPLREQGAAGK